jgi:glucan phosphoethanolaminetransferase (alkaline phosphatase superfamily)
MMNPSNLPTIVNTYDNSLLYTDFILSSIIDRVNDKQAVSFAMYVSDHGENLGDGENKLFFQGTPFLTKAEMQMPVIIWNSDSYKSVYPKKVESLAKNKEAKLSTNLSFHTILDMADIGYPKEQLNLSPANNSFEELKERWVLDVNIKPMHYD